MAKTALALSIIVTSYREENTVGQAIKSLLSQDLPQDYELLVVCPDDKTQTVAQRYVATNQRVRHLRDRGHGKPAALNLALDVAAGDIVILSDGDVYVGAGAVRALLEAFDDPRVGIVSGRPVSVSPRATMLGYWSHLLVDAGAHQQRTLRANRGEFLECSGYLYAFRRSLWEPIPEDVLAEDGLISYKVWQQGYRTAYAPEALVYVKYPTSYQDWMKQKTRSTGGYAQRYLRGAKGMRSLRQEAIGGVLASIRYAESLREFWWTILLFAARVHVWLRVWWNVKLRRRPFEALWQRVESTK